MNVSPLPLLLAGLLSAAPPPPTERDVAPARPASESRTGENRTSDNRTNESRTNDNQTVHRDAGTTSVRWHDHYHRFRSVISREYVHWGFHDHERFTRERLTRLIDDRHIQGESAAALAALHHVLGMRANREIAVNSDWFNAEIDEKKVDNLRIQRALALYYGLYLMEIKGTKRELFPPGAPSLVGLHQGQLSDCYVLAPIGSLVSERPEAIRQMIRQESEGYVVEFPGLPREPVHVKPLSDAQIALTSRTGEQGLWPKVLEIAVGKVDDFEHARGEASEDGHGTVADSAFTIKFGDCDWTIRLLTGHVSIPHSPQKHGGAPLREKMAAALRDKRIVAAGTPKEGTEPAHIARSHDLAVLGLEGETVHLWNPWGNNFEPKGAAGYENGYPTQGGKFSMPFEQFERAFHVVFIEGERASTGHRRERSAR